MKLLDVKDLYVRFKTADGVITAVNNLDFSINEGEILGIVGESGSGKSQSIFAILGLLAKNGNANGEVIFNEKNILTLSKKEINKIRAKEISIIFQDPMTSLNPYMKIKQQLSEVLIKHEGLSKGDAINKSLKMLDAVKIPEAKKRLSMYPHELSGGMRQRVMIAMSLLCKPKLLIADEPTTALDVTVQAQIMELLKEIRRDFNTSIILITHDLGVVAGTCDNTLVMYAGRVMEYGSVNDIFYKPSHPYTKGLLKAIPRLDTNKGDLKTIPGDPPNLLNLPKGCPYQDRCEFTMNVCKKNIPSLESFDNSKRKRACFLEFEE